MASPVAFRSAGVEDVDAILTLWQLGGIDHDEVGDRFEIVTKLDYDADLFVVAARDDKVVASVMGTYDGHRGRIKRCVVDPAEQRSGVGRQVVAELERRFVARGITELRLEVWADNTGAQTFWSTMGWEHLEDIRYYTRSLRTD